MQDLLDLVQRLSAEVLRLQHLAFGLLHELANRPDIRVLQAVVRTHRQLELLDALVEVLVDVGLAVDEYKDEFRRGDYLIRNLVGVDRERGVIAIGAHPRVGQTIQFQMRDAAAADEDLRELLGSARRDAGGAHSPSRAILCSCNGRGAGLFGAPDHDARGVATELGPVPLAGFFCNGEIGPVGSKTFLHGFTASLALLVARDD